MKYILDDLGFIEAVSYHPIECDNKTWLEYTGAIPEGYESLDDWILNANIRAYKIVENNLTYDAARDAALEAEWEETTFSPALIQKNSNDKKMYATNANGECEEILNVKYANNQQNYSTNEQVIGTWINGKPLYRKAYNFTTPSSALNLQIKIDNIDYDYITMTDKSVLLDNIGNSKSMPMNFVTSSTFICRANVQYTSVAGWFVYFVYPSDVKNKKGIVVVEYTKTTD
jgi:hypothetical protein